jgi:ABC-type multidrug transport system ATPase subunit/pSer/pThr/pTyr-binding forkhead associated (FHA) protein
MNIILADVNQLGGHSSERQFTKRVVTIGRGAAGCDIAFDSTQFPMVSRKHAELRYQDDTWFIIDLNSSYGTYLNGQRITQPRPVPVGSRIQFGTDGPTLVVIWFEVVSDAFQPIAPASVSVATPIAAAPAVPKPVSPPASLPPAQLEFVGSPQRPPLKIVRTSMWIGREKDCDVIFHSDTATVSRRHAEIVFENDDYLLKDNKSFNGTLLNGQRISTPLPLYHKDEIQLGLGGPVLIFNSPERVPPAGASLAGQRSVHAIEGAKAAADLHKTMVASFGHTPNIRQHADEPQLMMTVPFGDKDQLTIGRAESNDIRIDGLQISNNHARLRRSGTDVVIEDLHSTNGVFINGTRVSKQVIRPGDSAQIGSFVIRVDQTGNVGVFDSRSKIRIDVVNISRQLKGRHGVKINLLDGVSLSIEPNEFVGLLGPSGAGKSSLVEAMNGVRPARSGNVLINHLDVNRHFDSLKQSIGYVPQEDVIHRELSVYRTLYYVARLRLSRDVSRREIDQIVNEVMDVTGLTERRNVQVSRLSGGQRKRVSIAVELITKPSVIFLDEPTSGLDPATGDRIMRLFKQIAESGRTIVMTTHAMENVKLFDKIAILMRGKLVFFGRPEDALKYLNAANFNELYAKLEEPVNEGVKQHGEKNRSNLEDHAAAEWRQKFLATPQYKQLIEEPLKQVGTLPRSGVRKRRRLGIFGAIWQWMTLSRRYTEVLVKDKLNLFILFAQAPVIAFLTFIVMGANRPRDFVYFVLTVVAIWFGTSVSAREIVREGPIYRRERMFNLGLIPYLFSKLLVLGVIVFLQCVLLYLPLKFFHATGLMPMPGFLYGIPQFWVMLLTAAVGIGTGLLVSSLVRTSRMATSLVPLILIPQILFAGLIGVPYGLNRVVSMTIPAAWSFDTMKRFSSLETLEPEGANPRDSTKGLGLYKYLESENERSLEKAKRDLDNLKQISSGDIQTSDPSLADQLVVPEIKKVPADLSPYVTFLHPWMNEVLNQIVLMLMFWILTVCTLIVLRLKDIR